MQNSLYTLAGSADAFASGVCTLTGQFMNMNMGGRSRSLTFVARAPSASLSVPPFPSNSLTAHRCSWVNRRVTGECGGWSSASGNSGNTAEWSNSVNFVGSDPNRDGYFDSWSNRGGGGGGGGNDGYMWTGGGS